MCLLKEIRLQPKFSHIVWKSNLYALLSKQGFYVKFGKIFLHILANVLKISYLHMFKNFTSQMQQLSRKIGDYIKLKSCWKERERETMQNLAKSFNLDISVFLLQNSKLQLWYIYTWKYCNSLLRNYTKLSCCKSHVWLFCT